MNCWHWQICWLVAWAGLDELGGFPVSKDSLGDELRIHVWEGDDLDGDLELSEKALSREYMIGLQTDEVPVHIPYLDDSVMATVVPLASLLVEHGDDPHVLAYCYDGYVSYFPSSFIERYDPYVVLRFKGYDVGRMQLEGGPDMGPYYISFAKPLKQGSAEIPDPDNKRAYGVYKLEIGSKHELIGELFSGPLSDLPSEISTGRELWINNCMSCHSWGAEGPGGAFSNRTVQILAIHAKFNKSYFYNFVRDPSSLMPGAKMSKHPHYEDSQIEAIRQYLAAKPE